MQILELTNRNYISLNWVGSVCQTRQSPILPETHTVYIAVTREESGHPLPGEVPRTCRHHRQSSENIAILLVHLLLQIGLLLSGEKVANTVLSNSKNNEKIEKWLSNPNSRPRLLLKYKGNGEIIGRSASRKLEIPKDVASAKVILKKDNNDSYILTRYPVK